MGKSKARSEKRANPKTNVDRENLRILVAEKQNLELGRDTWTDKEKTRYNDVVKKITELKAKKEEGGNPNTQKR